jgi:large subunit ribosomal protein L3
MEKYIIGKKLGMTQIFDETGKVVPITVIEIPAIVVTQIKTQKTDGYDAVQIGAFEQKKSATTKPEEGRFKKAGVTPKKILREFRTAASEEYKLGDEIKCNIFAVGDTVDVTANSRGHGTAGVIQRWNGARGRMSHGAGPVHRSVGSMGAHTFPARVFKNKHMAGLYGNERVTVKNLQVVKVDTAKNCLLIKGSIPGTENRIVVIKEAKSVRVKK